MSLRRQRKALGAEEFVRVRISGDVPDNYKKGYRHYLLTPAQAFELFDDLRAALEGQKELACVKPLTRSTI